MGERGKGEEGKELQHVALLNSLSVPARILPFIIVMLLSISPCPCCRAFFLPQPEQLGAHSDANGYCKVGRP